MFDTEALLNSSPPLFAIAASLAIGILLGLTFERCLRLNVSQWRQGMDDLNRAQFDRQILSLAIPFWGAAIAVGIGFGGCIQLFGFQPPAAYSFSAAVSAVGGGAVWWQLASVLQRIAAKQFERV
ncbi:MAG: hypothetical protein AAFY15_07800 [Cyanobacteria bacterium J06648_11]